MQEKIWNIFHRKFVDDDDQQFETFCSDYFNLFSFFCGQSYKTSQTINNTFVQWKGINRKQSMRWQHLSQLKASAFFSFQFFLVFMKHSNLYLRLVLPSGGWQSHIGFFFERSSDWQKVHLNTALLKPRHRYLYRKWRLD